MEARRLIDETKRISKANGLNQSRWSEEAGYAINGQTVSRILKKGDCRVSTLINLLRVVGCKLQIAEDDREGV